ncbi:hypothetical protein ABZ801_26775 [Actinomadura sp. NPDC047616]|uniref:hypothetical protein n=1 Tax=Actinomadura sp. NPDC047616 TaxID=3155914 RepID=UPI0033C4DF3B
MSSDPSRDPSRDRLADPTRTVEFGAPAPVQNGAAPARQPPPEHEHEHDHEPDRGAGSRARTLAVIAVTVTVLPAVALTVPGGGHGALDAARDELRLNDAGAADLVRATGATLPALLVAVPLAAVTVRRLPARPVLAAGLLCLLGGLVAVRYAGSVPFLAAARAAQGLGAGIALPAALVLALERRRALPVALWAGTLAAVLLAAMPVALRAAPRPDPATGAVDWRLALAPYPQVAAVALGAALLCLLLRDTAPAEAPPAARGAARSAERGQLLLPAAPAAGLGFLAVVTTYGWSPGARLVVAGVGVVTLLGLALTGGRDDIAANARTTPDSRACAVVMVAVGLLAFPVTGPLAGLVQAAAGEGGGVSPVPFAAAACAAVAGALATVRLPPEGARGAVHGGFGLVVVAVLLTLAVDGTAGRWTLTACLVPLGAGLGTALAASLRGTSAGAALYGLSLCPPAILTGQLIVLSLQAGQWQRGRPETAAQQFYALSAGYRVWLITAGVLTVALAAAAGRRAPSGRTSEAVSGGGER